MSYPGTALLALVGAILLIALIACDDSEPQVTPPGREESAKTGVLEFGAKVMQTGGPLDGYDVYLDGFHPMKADPEHQMEAHHFCRQVNEDFAQCVLFDGNTPDANLNGIEYIISEALFESLPESERQYWHPHNFEILSGQLVAPNIPDIAEKELMRGKINSYGKTWHVWFTGGPGAPGDKLPLGDAMLAWSFNRNGEARPGLVEERDKRMNIDSAAKRRGREELVKLSRPQWGVDALEGRFPRPTEEMAGVVEAGK